MRPADLARQLNDPRLPFFLKQLDKRLLETATASPSFGRPVTRLIKAGGKRLRPALVYFSYSCSRPADGQKVIIAAAAVELTHLASLVHDDIIDHAAERRGQPSAAERLGAGEAVLIGDFLLAAAFLEAARLGELAVSWLADTIALMSDGAARENAPQRQLGNADRIYTETIRRKTGSLFGLSCQLGGWLAGLSPQQTTNLRVYGESFGIAFQMIDDWLDGDISQSPSRLRAIQRYNRKATAELEEFRPSSALKCLQEIPDLCLRSTIYS